METLSAKKMLQVACSYNINMCAHTHTHKHKLWKGSWKDLEGKQRFSGVCKGELTSVITQLDNRCVTLPANTFSSLMIYYHFYNSLQLFLDVVGSN